MDRAEAEQGAAAVRWPQWKGLGSGGSSGGEMGWSGGAGRGCVGWGCRMRGEMRTEDFGTASREILGRSWARTRVQVPFTLKFW